MERKNTFLFALFFAACTPQPTAPAPTPTVSSASSKRDAGVENGVAQVTVIAAVTRHLPGTVIVASGKYYLVQSDGTAAPFAGAALVTASGYSASMTVAATSDELNCYGNGEPIAAALPAPAAGRLADGTLVKEKGKSDTYAVSDGIAWPILNGQVFAEAGYNFANVVEVAAGTLPQKVEAVGNCAAGIACLDEAYLLSCAKDVLSAGFPGDGGNGGASGDETPSPGSAAAAVTRHLPGTVITTATGKYAYLVKSDGTIAPFASADLAAASGFDPALVITVSAEELYCYRRGPQITAPLDPAPPDRLQDGTLVKEKGKSDTYAVSDGIAWPILNGQVFADAGYDFANVVELAAGSLAQAVAAVGDCGSRVACLDGEYLRTCADDEAGDPTENPSATSTATATATATSTAATATATATATSTAATTTVATVNTAETSSTATQTASATAPPTATATNTATQTQTATATKTVAATETQSATATGTSSSAFDLSWAYLSDGSKLCLNAAYFVGGGKAVLVVWSGPEADPLNGLVAENAGNRFCWDFSGNPPGSYRFWADAPISSCSAGVCPRDHDESTGALYYRGSLLTAAAHAWLYCPTADSGCDGIAFWDGAAFAPMGN